MPTKSYDKFVVACSCSHIKAIKTAYENNLKAVFIFEDDIYSNLKNKWKETLNEILYYAPADTECIQFVCINDTIVKNMITLQQRFIPWHREHWSTGCYYINRKGMQVILDLFVKNNKINLNHSNSGFTADGDIVYKYLKTYTYTKPTFIWQAQNSTIHDSHLNGHQTCLNTVLNYFK